MRNLLIFISLITVATASVGCCGPMGPACAGPQGCYDCEGGFGPRTMAYGPIDALRNAKRSLICGGGCGEVYYGEWISTPPLCEDPCCGSEFTGSYGPRARPFCWAPGALLPRNVIAGLYGKRFIDDGCGECVAGCDTCGDTVIGGDYSGEYYDDGTVFAGQTNGGCASCASNHYSQPANSPVATGNRTQPRPAGVPGRVLR